MLQELLNLEYFLGFKHITETEQYVKLNNFLYVRRI